MIGQSKMCKSGSLDLTPVWSRSSVGNEVDTKFTLGCFYCGIGGSSRNLESLCIQFKVMNQGLHRSLHFSSGWWNTFSIIRSDVAFRHSVQALFNDPQRLTHFLHADQVPIVAIAVGANRNIKLIIFITTH